MSSAFSSFLFDSKSQDPTFAEYASSYTRLVGGESIRGSDSTGLAFSDHSISAVPGIYHPLPAFSNAVLCSVCAGKVIVVQPRMPGYRLCLATSMGKLRRRLMLMSGMFLPHWRSRSNAALHWGRNLPTLLCLLPSDLRLIIAFFTTYDFFRRTRSRRMSCQPNN